VCTRRPILCTRTRKLMPYVGLPSDIDAVRRLHGIISTSTNVTVLPMTIARLLTCRSEANCVKDVGFGVRAAIFKYIHEQRQELPCRGCRCVARRPLHFHKTCRCRECVCATISPLQRMVLKMMVSGLPVSRGAERLTLMPRNTAREKKN
jgi:hypothetical protein